MRKRSPSANNNSRVRLFFRNENTTGCCEQHNATRNILSLKFSFRHREAMEIYITIHIKFPLKKFYFARLLCVVSTRRNKQLPLNTHAKYLGVKYTRVGKHCFPMINIGDKKCIHLDETTSEHSSCHYSASTMS